MPAKGDTIANWAECKELYLAGAKLSDISTRLGIPYTAIKKISSREHWTQSKRDIYKRVDSLTLTDDKSPLETRAHKLSPMATYSASLIQELKSAYQANVGAAARKASEQLAQSVNENSSLVESGEAFSAFEPVSRVASKALGLDQPTVQVNQMFNTPEVSLEEIVDGMDVD